MITENILTEREKEILTLLAGGKVRKEVAHLLKIDRGTLNYHLSQVYSKLKVANSTESVAYAVEHKLITVQKHRRDEAA